MRVYISVDMEGIAGVVHESQTNPGDPAFAHEYARFRRLMTAEANAAIAGAQEAGATAILVNDSHWHMRNLLAEELNEGAELLSGDPKPRSMMEGIDSEGGFDAAICIGYHAKAGTDRAILDHTYADKILDARLNERSVGELGLNAALAGVHGVPVVLVSGDRAFAAEAQELLGKDLTTVVVKEAVGRHAARSIAPAEACRRIRAAAAKALRQKRPPFVVPPPITLAVDFALTSQADMAEVCPGAKRVTGRTVEYRHENYREVFRAWRAMVNLANNG